MMLELCNIELDPEIVKSSSSMVEFTYIALSSSDQEAKSRSLNGRPSLSRSYFRMIGSFH